jgi:hypothetical protein
MSNDDLKKRDTYPLLPVTLEGFVSAADVARIARSTSQAKIIDTSKFPVVASKLERLHAIVIAMTSERSKQAQGLPVKDLRHMRNYARKLRDLLNPEKHRVACDAIHAAALNGALKNRGLSSKRQHNLGKEISGLLEHLEASINYLFAQRAEFHAIPPHDRAEWLLRLDRPGEWHAKRELYPFLQGSENLEVGEKALPSEAHERTDYYLLKNIAALYKEYFDEDFSVVQRSGKADYDPKSGDARYSGPSIRFALAVVNQLGLSSVVLDRSSVSGRTEEDRIVNRLGDIWVHIKRTADEEVASSL